MISTQTFQDCRAINLGSGLHDYCEHCQRQVAEAETEMSAFVLAVGRVWDRWLPPVLQSTGLSWRRVPARCL